LAGKCSKKGKTHHNGKTGMEEINALQNQVNKLVLLQQELTKAFKKRKRGADLDDSSDSD
jgi:hypothetical protein